MNYYLWMSGEEHGPYSLDQIQKSIDDGDINPQQTARTEDSADWKPLHQIARLKLPTPKKPEPKPAQQPALAAQNPKAVASHLADIRRNSCYKVLRSVIEISFVLGLIGVGFSAVYTLITGRASERIFAGGLGILGIILLTAAYQSALVLIDIADTLLNEHAKGRNA